MFGGYFIQPKKSVILMFLFNYAHRNAGEDPRRTEECVLDNPAFFSTGATSGHASNDMTVRVAYKLS